MTDAAPVPVTVSAAASRDRVLFIAGLGRSGSTLLDRMLGQVPGCCNIGEASQVWKNLLAGTRCGCGRRPRECPFWTAVVQAGWGGWDGLDIAAARRLQRTVDRTRYLPFLVAGWAPPRFRARRAAYAGLLGVLYRAVAVVSGARVVVDSGKHTSTAYLLTHVRSVDLRVVHLVRDSRGVAYSWTKVVAKSHHEDAATMDQLRPAQVARGWMVHNVLLHALALRRVPRLFLRYEDLVAGPRERLRDVVCFAGLPAAAADAPFVDDRHVDLRAEDHTLAGNPLRFRRDTVTISADEAWRRELPGPAQRRVTAVTAPLLLAYRYRLRSAGATARRRTNAGTGTPDD